MRQCLTEREAELVTVELAPKQHGDDLGGAPRLRDGVERVGQARVVMRAHLHQALGHPRKGSPCAGRISASAAMSRKCSSEAR